MVIFLNFTMRVITYSKTFRQTFRSVD